MRRARILKVKRNNKRTNIRRCLLALAGLILGLNIYLFNAHRLAGNSLPMPFGYGAAVVLSGSMEPALSKNDLIFIHRTDDFKTGDIVVYQDWSELVVHRVIRTDGNMVQTKGDANNVEDAPVDKSQIRGTVVGHICGVGVIAIVLQTPAAIIGILIAALLLIELSYRREKTQIDQTEERIKNEIERLKQEKNKDET